MPIISIPIYTVVSSPEVPNEIRQYVPLHVWNQIKVAKLDIESRSFYAACGVEWLCCCMCIPILPFLCHTCFVGWFSNAFIEDKFGRLSMDAYGRVGALRIDQRYLYVNTDLIMSNYGSTSTTTNHHNYHSQCAIAPVYTPSADYHSPEVVYAEAIPDTRNQQIPLSKQYMSSYTDNMTTATSTSYSTPVIGTAIHTRTMRVRVPPNTSPGTTMNVTSPEGLTVQVVIPPGASSGSEIDIQY